MDDSEEIRQSQQKWDRKIRFLMNCFAACCALLVLLFALYAIYGGDPTGSFIDEPQCTGDGIVVKLFNQPRAGMARFEFLLLVKEAENMPELTTRQFSHFREQELVTRLEEEGIAIVDRADLSGKHGELEVTFDGLADGQAYILLAPEMSDGNITNMWTFRISCEAEGGEVE